MLTGSHDRSRMLVRDAMSTDVLRRSQSHAERPPRLDVESKVGAAVVMDGDQDQPGDPHRGDILDAIGCGQDVTPSGSRRH